MFVYSEYDYSYMLVCNGLSTAHVFVYSCHEYSSCVCLKLAKLQFMCLFTVGMSTAHVFVYSRHEYSSHLQYAWVQLMFTVGMSTVHVFFLQ